jgi:hypothetical protein
MPLVSGVVILVMLVSTLLFFVIRKYSNQNNQANSSKIDVMLLLRVYHFDSKP